MKYIASFLFFFLFSTPLFGDLKIAVFGNGREINEMRQGLNDALLAKVFTQIKVKKPDAVFFTGSLLLGLESPETYSPEAFKKQLEKFSFLKDSYLGKEVPFYPTLGNHYPTNFETVEIFREHFGIKNIAPRPPHHLSYTVTIDNTDFIVLATGYEDPNGVVETGVRPKSSVIDWLENYLRYYGDRFDHRLVFGHFPAYSSKGTEGKYVGLDRDPAKRDLFWRILKENRVVSYLCSHEELYDRSNRRGVWQVISGGVGARKRVFQTEKSFSHFVMITIFKGDKFPVVEAIDLNGKVWDTFELEPLDYPIHQLRISEKAPARRAGN